MGDRGTAQCLSYNTGQPPGSRMSRPQMSTVVRFRNWALTSGLKAFRSRMTSWPLRIPSGSKTLRSAHLSQGDPVPATESFELKFIRGDSQHILRLPRKGVGRSHAHTSISPVKTQPAPGGRWQPEAALLLMGPALRQPAGTRHGETSPVC